MTGAEGLPFSRNDVITTEIKGSGHDDVNGQDQVTETHTPEY